MSRRSEECRQRTERSSQVGVSELGVGGVCVFYVL